MNINFALPDPLDAGVELATPLAHVRNIHKTEYNSSLKIIQLIRPANILLLNVPNQPTFRAYTAEVPRLFKSGG